jgi:hypothetical protein
MLRGIRQTRLNPDVVTPLSQSAYVRRGRALPTLLHAIDRVASFNCARDTSIPYAYQRHIPRINKPRTSSAQTLSLRILVQPERESAALLCKVGSSHFCDTISDDGMWPECPLHLRKS